ASSSTTPRRRSSRIGSATRSASSSRRASISARSTGRRAGSSTSPCNSEPAGSARRADMTPQGNFMVAAAIRPDCETALRQLLATMNLMPGVVDPQNALFPFCYFATLHVARFVILKDETLGDRPADDPFRDAPLWLVFLGDCDGEGGAFIAEAAAKSD